MPKLNYADRTHLVLPDSATKELIYHTAILRQTPPHLILGIPKDFFLSILPRFIDGTAVLRQWTVLKLDCADRTHLVLLGSATKNSLI